MSRMHGLDEERRRGIAVVRLAFLVTMFVTGIDQAVKVLVLILFGGDSYIHVIAPGLRLIVIWDRGISFGLLGGEYPLLSWLLLLIGSLGIGFLAFAALDSSRCMTAIAFGLLMGGALGNLIDRVRFGAILDYLQLRVMGTTFLPVTNLANVAIFFGGLVLLIDQFFVAGTVYVPAASRVTRSARPWFQP
jgi:signal peptidase II